MSGHSPETPIPRPNTQLATLLGDEFFVPQIDQALTLGGLMVDTYLDGAPGTPDPEEQSLARNVVGGLVVRRQESPAIPGVWISAYASATSPDNPGVFAGIQLEAKDQPTLRVLGGNKICRVTYDHASAGRRGIMSLRTSWLVLERAGTASAIAFDAGAIFQHTHHRTHGG